jgi:ankyrin repeat protein
LLDHGAVIYSEDSEQKSPLHYAVERKLFRIFKLLLNVVEDPLVRSLLPLLRDFKDWDVENLLSDLVLAERRLGGDHKDTIKITGEIADALYSMQSLKAARDWYRRVLEWQERELGKEHSETLQTSKRITELNDVIRE